jgi:hypothetical protein
MRRRVPTRYVLNFYFRCKGERKGKENESWWVCGTEDEGENALRNGRGAAQYSPSELVSWISFEFGSADVRVGLPCKGWRRL